MERVLREQAELAGRLRDAALVEQGTASAALADSARADIEVARQSSAVRVNRARQRAAEAMLNTALGRNAHGAVPRLDFRVATKSPPLSRALVPRARAQRPELRAARAELSRARAEVEAMESTYGPMAFFRVGPAYTMAAGMGVMGMMGVSLPIVIEPKRAGVREAESMVGMATADIEAMTRMIDGEVATAREQVEAERIHLLTVRREILPRARVAVDAGLVAYAAGQVPLVSAIEAFLQLGMAREQEIAAEAALGMARARLDRALGNASRRRR
jgi:cobalt-zinc-cadmium efflux system outer membrane protein